MVIWDIYFMIKDKSFVAIKTSDKSLDKSWMKAQQKQSLNFI